MLNYLSRKCLENGAVLTEAAYRRNVQGMLS